MKGHTMSKQSPISQGLARLGMALVVALTACAQVPPAEAPAEAPLVVQAPGDRSLEQGVQLYQSARYEAAETVLKAALLQGISNGPDVARAHKFLAFIYCTSKRETLCAGAFRSAREADSSFELSKVEAGHPLWGPVYRKAMATRGK